MRLCVWAQWFKGGTTNICYNCLDRNVKSGLGDKTAIYWEGNELGVGASLTYGQLLERVCQVNNLYVLPYLHTFCFVANQNDWNIVLVSYQQLANYMKDIGVRKGDAVVIYLPMLMELPIAMLACARIGAVHSVLHGNIPCLSLGSCNCLHLGINDFKMFCSFRLFLLDSLQSLLPRGS